MLLLSLTSPDDMLWRFSIVLLLCAVVQILHDIHMSLRHLEHYAAITVSQPAAPRLLLTPRASTVDANTKAEPKTS